VRRPAGILVSQYQTVESTQNLASRAPCRLANHAQSETFLVPSRARTSAFPERSRGTGTFPLPPENEALHPRATGYAQPSRREARFERFPAASPCSVPSLQTPTPSKSHRSARYFRKSGIERAQLPSLVAPVRQNSSVQAS